jgi:hypothetical protein
MTATNRASAADGDAGVLLECIVSGGQTGVDRAALDVALEVGIPCEGWCPRGRKAEDGGIAARYPLQETPSARYAERTEWNVRDSDGTLILTAGPPVGGTALTIACASRLGKSQHTATFGTESADPALVLAWLREHSIRRLNVAGPRESQQPGIYDRTRAFLRSLLSCRPQSDRRDP